MMYELKNQYRIGKVVAGGNGLGSKLNQLSAPMALVIGEDNNL